MTLHQRLPALSLFHDHFNIHLSGFCHWLYISADTDRVCFIFKSAVCMFQMGGASTHRTASQSDFASEYQCKRNVGSETPCRKPHCKKHGGLCCKMTSPGSTHLRFELNLTIKFLH